MRQGRNQRTHKRTAYDQDFEFTVLYMASDFRRILTAGKIVDKSPLGIGIETDFPLEPGHVLEWDDVHHKGKLHIALVKWASKLGACYRAGLIFI